MAARCPARHGLRGVLSAASIMRLRRTGPERSREARVTHLTGKTAVVTGGSAGIGLATARALHGAGARVVLIARDGDRLARAAAEFPKGDALIIQGDVADTERLPILLEQCPAIDVLVNNAGVHHRGAMLRHSAQELAEMVSANLTAPIVLARLAADVMPAGGRIVNVASLAGKLPVPGSAVYSGTKAGLRFWALAVAEDMAERGIGVATVNPGPVDTAFVRADFAHVSPISASQPWSTPERVAEAVLAAILSDRSPLEIDVPYLSGKMAAAVYAIPAIRPVLRPVMQWKGERALRRMAASGGDRSNEAGDAPQRLGTGGCDGAAEVAAAAAGAGLASFSTSDRV